MFEPFDDPNPPHFESSDLARIERRCRTRQRRTRLAAVSVVSVPTIALGGVLLARSSGDEPDRVVTSQPDETLLGSTTTAPDIQPTSSPTTTVSDVEYPLLGDRNTSLSDDEWLLPLDLPDGYEQTSGTVTVTGGLGPEGHPVSSDDVPVLVRTVSITSPADVDATFTGIEIAIASGPTGRIGSINGAAPVEDQVDGVAWMIAEPAGDNFLTTHFAQRDVGSGTVTITTFGDMTADDFRAAIASLAIVPRSVFSGPIHDPWSPDTIEVGAFEAFGDDISIRVQRFDPIEGQADDWACTYRMRGDGYSSTCGDDPLNAGITTGTDWHHAHHNEETNVLEVYAYGLVDPDVASVELLMFNGEIVTVAPDPSRADIEQQFWSMVGSFEIGQRLDGGDFPVFLPPTIQSITASDIEGNVLAVVRR